MKLIFVNRFFHPDHSATSQMLSGVAFGLAARGRHVLVITSRQRYEGPQDSLPASETIEGVDVHRIWTTRFGRSNLIGRAFDYLTFYLVAALTVARLARRGDVVIAKTDPPMLAVAVAPAVRLRGARLVNWQQDIFPEVAEALLPAQGVLARWAFALMRTLRNASIRTAAANIALGQRMKSRLVSLGAQPQSISIIPNFADGSVIRPIAHGDNGLRHAWGLDQAFVAGYSGNLGRAHDYQTLIDAMAILEGSGAETAPVTWLFIGGGARYEDFKHDVRTRGVTSVVFLPYQPREKLAESLSVADVHLVSLRPELEGLIVPSKFYGIAAAGRPAIFIGGQDGEIARLLEAHATGITVPEGDGPALAAAIRLLQNDSGKCAAMGAAARHAFEQNWDSAVAVARWDALLQQVSADR